MNSRVGGGLDFVSRLLDKICTRSSDNKRILQNYHDERLKTQTSANSKLNLAEEKYENLPLNLVTVSWSYYILTLLGGDAQKNVSKS